MPENITAQTHKFVGTWRPTREEMASFIKQAAGAYVVKCPCGHQSKTTQGVWECWRDGCFDSPIYKPIDEA